MSGSNRLAQEIRDRIRKNGPVSFAWFMEQALYHPLYGYYSTERTRIGQTGDFYTNVSVGDLFGTILAEQFLELFGLLGAPDNFKLVEQGAENAQLAKDVLKALATEPKSSAWEYWIVEPSAQKIAIQKAHLGQTVIPVHWTQDPANLPAVTGIVFCNELLDALPCHLVEHNGEDWNEIHVEEKNGEFGFVSRPIDNRRLANQMECLPVPSITPYRTEVNLAALDWIKSAARALSHGFILVIDYGFPSWEFYAPLRTEGTLTGYHQHQRQKDLLARPGEIDITAHIDFSSIAQAALSEGCTLVGFTDQHHFMVGAAEKRLREIEQLANQGSITSTNASGRRRTSTNVTGIQRFLRQYKSLMHPHTMGLAFKYLLLGKGVSLSKVPSGFKYGKDPATALC